MLLKLIAILREAPNGSRDQIVRSRCRRNDNINPGLERIRLNKTVRGRWRIRGRDVSGRAQWKATVGVRGDKEGW